jgi:hypothetical protein
LASQYDIPGDGDAYYGNPLPPEESLDEDEFGEDIADGYSPQSDPGAYPHGASRPTRSPGMKAWNVAWRVNSASLPTSPKGNRRFDRNRRRTNR